MKRLPPKKERAPDTEEWDELLRMQEDFLATKKTPSAKVKRITPKVTKPPVKQDIVTLDQPAFFEIQEKQTTKVSVKPPKQRKTAFPEVFKVEDNEPISPMQIEQQQRHEQFLKTDVNEAISQNSLDKIRFDFQGNIIPKTSDIPTHLGLHHHGEEPEAAGYNLPEIFYLIHSTVPAQRIVNIKIVKEIVYKIKSKFYSSSVPSLTIDYLVDSYQLSSVLIFAITDKNSTVAREGILLLHASLLNRDMKFIESLDNQYRELRLFPIESLEKQSPKSEKGSLLTQLLKKEVINKLCESKWTIEELPLIFDIIIFASRYSLESAAVVSQSIQLIELIRNQISLYDSESHPVTARFLSILRCICQSGKQHCQALVNNGTLSMLRRLISHSTYNDFSHFLTIETLKIWKTCAQYEIEEPAMESISLLTEQLSQTISESNTWTSNIRFFSEKTSAIFNLFEIGSKSWKRTHKSLIDSAASSALNILGKIIQMWTEFEQMKENRNYFYLLIGNLLHFLSAFTENVDNKLLYTKIIPLVTSLVESNSFTFTVENLMKISSVNDYSIQSYVMGIARLIHSLQKNEGYKTPGIKLWNQLVSMTTPISSPFENRMIVLIKYHILLLLASEEQPSHEKRIQYNAACGLVHELLITDLPLLKTLFFHILFNNDFISSLSPEYERDAFATIPSFLLKYLEDSVRLEPNTLFIQLLKGKPSDSKLLLPFDWIYFPISTLYEESQLRKDEDLEQRSEEDLNIIRETLQYVEFTEESKFQYVSELPSALKFYNLMKVFFLGDAFFDNQINHHLSHLYDLLMHLKLDFERLGSSFDDFLLNFFDQFNASSFGHSTFTKYVIAFLRMDLPLKYRKKLFTELGESSHILRIDIEQFANIDLAIFLLPFEREQEILSRYVTTITSSNFTTANSFFYWLGIHHLSSFLFVSTSGLWLKAQLIQPILQFEKVFNDVFYYLYNSPDSFKHCVKSGNPTLPPETQFMRSELLQQIHNTPVKELVLKKSKGKSEMNK